VGQALLHPYALDTEGFKTNLGRIDATPWASSTHLSVIGDRLGGGWRRRLRGIPRAVGDRLCDGIARNR
jgi:hypothetical protein